MLPAKSRSEATQAPIEVLREMISAEGSDLGHVYEGISFCGRHLQQSILLGKDIREEVGEIAGFLRIWLDQIPQGGPQKELQIKVLKGLCCLLRGEPPEDTRALLDLEWALGSSRREERILGVMYLLCWEKLTPAMLSDMQSSLHSEAENQKTPREIIPLLHLEDWLRAHFRNLYIGQIPDVGMSKAALEMITAQEMDLIQPGQESTGFLILLLGLMHCAAGHLLEIKRHHGVISFVARQT